MSRRWPTLAREPVMGDVVYVGNRPGVVVAVIDGGWRVRYATGPDHEVRPRGMSDPERPAVVDESDPMVRAPCDALRWNTRQPHREWRAPTPKPRRVHARVADWQPLTGTWSWGRSATGVYVRDGADSMRDVWRPPPVVDAERALLHVVGAHRGLVELDRDASHEVALEPDVLERIMEVLT